jgi:ornithine cyclodeaminase/alanine dehydrogenase
VPEPTLILTRSQVGALLTLEECIPAMEAAFAAHHRAGGGGPRGLRPGLMHVEGVGGEFHVKGGGVVAGDAGEVGEGRAWFALKANGGFFGGPSRGVPSIRGLVLLFDGRNGDVLAAMDSRDVTVLRTAATTALAARLLSDPQARVATVCGCGGQAAAHVRALLLVRPGIEEVRVWSRRPERAAAFCARYGTSLGARLVPVAALSVATDGSGVVATLTPARGAFLRRADLMAGAFVAAVGADSPEKQELDPGVFAGARVVTDLTEQCERVGELHHAVAAGVLTAAGVYAELGALCAGAAQAGWDPSRVTVFDSTGTALQDAAAAALVYGRARAGGVGAVVDFLE